MLMKKTHRQIPSCEKTPPRVGPRTDDTAQTLAM